MKDQLINTCYWSVANWGTSCLRLWLIDKVGSVIERFKASGGVARISSDQYEKEFLKFVTPFLSENTLTKVICRGMAGLHQGLCETHYLQVPLNSPKGLKSISRMVDTYGQDGTIGAGTVLDFGQVQRLSDIGAKMIVSLNCSIDVLSKTKNFGLLSYPGCFTMTQCFSAIQSGADGLKKIFNPFGLNIRV